MQTHRVSMGILAIALLGAHAPTRAADNGGNTKKVVAVAAGAGAVVGAATTAGFLWLNRRRAHNKHNDLEARLAALEGIPFAAPAAPGLDEDAVSALIAAALAQHDAAAVRSSRSRSSSINSGFSGEDGAGFESPVGNLALDDDGSGSHSGSRSSSPVGGGDTFASFATVDTGGDDGEAASDGSGLRDDRSEDEKSSEDKPVTVPVDGSESDDDMGFGLFE